MAIVPLVFFVCLHIVLMNIFDIQTLDDYQFDNSSVIGWLTTEGHVPIDHEEGFGDFHHQFHEDEELEEYHERAENTTEEIFHEKTGESDLFNATFEDVITSEADEDDGCHCRQPVDAIGSEVFCRCYGESVTQMPTNLTQGLTRL